MMGEPIFPCLAQGANQEDIVPYPRSGGFPAVQGAEAAQKRGCPELRTQGAGGGTRHHQGTQAAQVAPGKRPFGFGGSGWC